MSNKTTFKDDSGNIHFGVNAPDGFSAGTKEDVSFALGNLGDKTLWRCTVCNDLHIGKEPPGECPTCFVKGAYVQIDLKEFKQLVEIL